MSNPINQYLQQLNTRFQTGIAREHSYRGDLQNLLETLCPDVLVTNEPARIKCGAPDYILTNRDIPVGYIEAKDLGADIGSKGYKEQFDRYRASLPNLIITNYIDFWLYRNGEFVTSIQLGTIENGKVVPNTVKAAEFEHLIKDFSTTVAQTIKSSKKLAEMMAGKARLLANVIENALVNDEQEGKHLEANNTLRQQLDAFKEILIHTITPKEFADIYAQTIAYGMFAARLHDATLENFSRQEAAELIPKTNPFLRKLFQYIAGYDLDDRLTWIVDALADIFRATDVANLLKDFGKATQQNDPILHFYETFLGEYDKKLRKQRGVWYTPEPVVNFIVRAVDDILKTEFGLKQGLADTSTTKIKVKVPTHDKRYKSGMRDYEQEVHKVQILDPATGTGTFLAEVIKHIYQKFSGQQGIWGGYVENHLLPRLNGFEILMASYAMAHLKLDLLLAETGYKSQSNQRFKVYLTNSLEEHHPDTGTLFANWLSTEATEANHIKRDTPVMVVMGNPPYSGESQNKGEWIMSLMDDYKKEPDNKGKLQERNPKWLNDDYVKFMRYGQHFIEKNGEGVLAFINPHGFLDNPTFRGMRWHLLKTYDKIYTIDLHGNTKKKETVPDGSKDENVFDIQQGVSINLLVKTGKKKPNELGTVHHFDLYGKREDKYKFLWENNIKTTPFAKLPNKAPMYFMVQKDFEAEEVYSKGFSIPDLFTVNNVGVVTSRDAFVIDENRETLENRIQAFFDLDKAEILKQFDLRENKSWKIDVVKEKAKSFNKENVVEVSYRPFDNRHLYYNSSFIERNRSDVTKHFIVGENLGFVFRRQQPETLDLYIFCSNKIVIDGYIRSDNKGGEYATPLYLYPENTEQQSIEANTERTPNLDKDITAAIAKGLGLTFINEKESTKNTFAPIDVLDYIYAVLHQPTYREKYKEFLKIDFPRVPYPTNAKTFWQLVKLGGQLRQIHLLESPIVEEYITTYPQGGNNEVSRKMTASSIGFELTNAKAKTGKVWINDEQYFDGIPQHTWEFYIGGYQPAQKWLKDRQGRILDFADILHYQKIIVALHQSHLLMQQIDKIEAG